MTQICRHVVLLTASLILAAGAHQSSSASFPWQPASQETLESRFPTPRGATRLAAKENSFGAWLRSLPLQPRGAPVLLFDGREKTREVHAAVVDLDIGSRDLQQCADAIMRLRAEYLRSAACEKEIAFNFTSGHRASWSSWSEGMRPRISGTQVTWSRAAAADTSYPSFRRYLQTVFIYAGSSSLARELESVRDASQMEPGDIFIEGGFPGHAVIVIDVAETADGERLFLLAQSYMPAQSLHILKNPNNPKSPWYRARADGRLATPEWTFDFTDLRRWQQGSCESRI